MPNNKKEKSNNKKREQLSEAQRWSQTGRVSAKGLSKQLPGLAQELRDGSVDPNEVADRLAALNLCDSMDQQGSTYVTMKANRCGR